MPTKEEMAAAAAKAAAAKAAKAVSAAKKEADTEEKKAPKKAAPKAEVQEPAAEKKPAKKAEEPAPKPAGDASSVKPLRIAAICLWVLALAAEVGAFIFLHKLVEMGTLNDEISNLSALLAYPQARWLLVMLAVDLILCIVAAQLWKKSNRIRPCLAKSALVRTLWHQLGVIMLLVCFIPIGIFLILKTKNLNPKVRSILLGAFAALFIAATAVSVDYKQPSKEEVAQLQAEAEAEAAAAGIDLVYWTKYGKSYHFDENCSALKRSNPENLATGSLDDAFGANRWDPCDYCAGGKEAKAQETGEQAPAPAEEPVAELAPAA